MREREITLPTIALIAGTRLALGIGIGFLMGGRLAPESRRAAGWALIACGVLTTIPLVTEVFGANVGDDGSEPSSEPVLYTRAAN